MLALKIIFTLFILRSFFSCSHRYPGWEDSLPQNLEEAVVSDFRDPENKKRDVYLHPFETLNFFEVEDSHQIVEISPGSGYFSEILASLITQKGKLYLAIPRMPSRPSQLLIDQEKKLQEMILRHKNFQSNIRLIPFAPIDKKNKLPAHFADRVLIFNSLHNWVAKKSIKQSFAFIHHVLKPGGVLGIVQHRIKQGEFNYPMSGYLTEDQVISFAQNAGFKLLDSSEINANFKDKANYPLGVWCLPPTYRMGNKDRERFEEIGESDKMTLKFIKK